MTPSLGTRGPAYGGEYYTPTLRLSLWHTFQQHTRGTRLAGPPQSPTSSFEGSGSQTDPPTPWRGKRSPVSGRVMCNQRLEHSLLNDSARASPRSRRGYKLLISGYKLLISGVSESTVWYKVCFSAKTNRKLLISGQSESTIWYKTNRWHIPHLRANSSDFRPQPSNLGSNLGSKQNRWSRIRMAIKGP